MQSVGYLFRRCMSVFANLFYVLSNIKIDVKRGRHTKIYARYALIDVSVGDYTYIGPNSTIRHTSIGKFCSIGPNVMCGVGIHPTNGISTSPVFYSTRYQTDITFSATNKADEHQPIEIGNDVFIGANVVILGGIRIGHGAVIGAGAVVTKDVPPYAIVGGVPAQIIRYRFDEQLIEKLLNSEWWNGSSSQLKVVEQYWDVPHKFSEIYSEQ